MGGVLGHVAADSTAQETVVVETDFARGNLWHSVVVNDGSPQM